MPGSGDLGAKDGEEHLREEERKKVVLEFEGETVEGTVEGILGGLRFALRENRVGRGTGVDGVAQGGWRVERVGVDD